RTFDAADPRVGDDLVANLDAGRVRSERRDLARDLVPHGEGQVHATRLQRDLLSVPQIEMSVPDMYVAVADSGRLDPQQHLLPLRLGVRVIPCFERLAPFNDLHRAHAQSSRTGARPFP